MAKKKAHKEPSSFTIRCGPKYRAWVERLVRKKKLERVTTLVTMLLHEYALKMDKTDEPPERMS